MHLVSPARIKSNSAELNAINRRIHNALPERGAEWQAAVADFHARFDQLVYPGGGVMLGKVRDGDPVALELAVRFLEVDPMHFRSGYLKEHLWNWLKRVDISLSVTKRLEGAAVGYLERIANREFWAMAKAMHHIARPGFWAKVAEVAESDQTPRGQRAVSLLAHGADLHAGAMVRRRVYNNWLRARYGGG